MGFQSFCPWRLRVRAPCLEAQKSTGQQSRSARCQCEMGGKACPGGETERVWSQLIEGQGQPWLPQPPLLVLLWSEASHNHQAITNFKIFSVSNISSLFCLFLCFFNKIHLFLFIWQILRTFGPLAHHSFLGLNISCIS